MIFKKTFLLVVTSLVFFGSVFVSAEVSISPYNPKNSSNWLIYEAKPGDRIKDSLKIQNTNSQDVITTLKGRDFTVTDSGQYTIIADSLENSSVGNWIKIPSDKVSVPSNKFTQIPFQIDIPKEAKDGEYSGGISMTEQKNPGESLDVTVRKGVRAYVAIGNNFNLSGKVENLKILGPKDNNYNDIRKSKLYFGRDNLVVSYEAENLGNIFATMTGKYSLVFPDGKVFENTFSQDLAPGVGVRTFEIISNQEYQIGKTQVIINYTIKPLNIDKEKVKINNNSSTLGASLEIKNEEFNNFALANQKAFITPGEDKKSNQDCKNTDCGNFQWSKVASYLGGFVFLIAVIGALFAGIHFYKKSNPV